MIQLASLKVKVLKGHIFIKRVQNDAYNKYKAELSDRDLLVHVNLAESYKSDQQIEIQSTYFGNQSFSLFTSCCYFKGATREIRNKSVVVVIGNSDHNKITSMSCLKKVIDTVETECGKRFTNVVCDHEQSNKSDSEFNLRVMVYRRR